MVAALSYIVGGYLGTLLEIPPSGASPVCPAVGIALALVLVYRARLLAGIFFGALFVQVYAFLDHSSTEMILSSLTIGSIVSVACCLQALAGVVSIERWVGLGDPLTEDRKIIRFMLLGCPLAYTVAATVGVTTLLIRGVITSDDVWLSLGNLVSRRYGRRVDFYSKSKARKQAHSWLCHRFRKATALAHAPYLHPCR